MIALAEDARSSARSPRARCALAQAEGEDVASEMLGTEVDLNRNLLDLIAAARLTATDDRQVAAMTSSTQV